MVELLYSVNNIWYVHHISLTQFVFAYEQNKVISTILSTLWCDGGVAAAAATISFLLEWRYTMACVNVYPKSLLCQMPTPYGISTTSN